MQTMSIQLRSIAAAILAAASVAACGGSTLEAPPSGLDITLSASQVHSLDSTGGIIHQAFPTDPSVAAVVDSALRTLSAGIVATHVTLTTNVQPAPQYMVGIHRVFRHATSSSSTWTVVAMDDPSQLHSLAEVGGFAQSSTSTAPETVSGTIGSSGNIGNGLALELGANNAVRMWRWNSGTASFASTPSSTPCPNFTATAVVSCTLETLRVSFNVTGTSGADTRTASTAAVDISAMRLTYNLP